MRFNAWSALVAAILAVFAPTLDAINCRCGHEAEDPASTSCCDDEVAGPAHDAPTPDADDDDRPCPSSGGTCCCERAHDAIPADEIVLPPAPLVTFVAPVAIEAKLAYMSGSVLRPFSRARCRDGPDLFVLSSLRL